MTTPAAEPRPESRSLRRLRPDAAGNAGLQRLADLAARLLNTGAAQVSLVADEDMVVTRAGTASESAPPPQAQSLCTVTVGLGAPLVVADAGADARVRHLQPVTSGALSSYLGVPLRASDGLVVGALCVFDSTPRTWTDTDVAIMAQLAESVMSELELSAVTQEFQLERVARELAIDAAGIGAFQVLPATGQVVGDARLLELFDVADGDSDLPLALLLERIHVDDRAEVIALLDQAVRDCGAYSIDHRIVLTDGRVRWVAARGRAVCDDDGAQRIVGAVVDTTLARESDLRLTRVLESMPAAFFSLDREWRFSYVNAETERLLRHSRTELLGGNVWELFPAAIASDYETHYRRAVDTGEAQQFEAYYPAPLNATYEVRAWPSPDGLSVYFLDISERLAAVSAAERAAVRTSLLADVSAALADTLDVAEAAARIARLVVPVLGDWCVVTLIDESASGAPRMRDVGSWHVDPDQRELTSRYADLRQSALTEESFVAASLASGSRIVVDTGATDAVSRVLRPGEAREIFLRLAPESCAVVPLQGRDRTLGIVTIFNGRDRGSFAPDDLSSLDEVAGRAGLALDNARLFGQQRQLAEGLQRALLSPPPESDDLEIVVRYEPAAEAAQVGGDWYDAFVQRSGSTVIVIGDVVGHDTAAAAAMGQLRAMLRGIAYSNDEGPAGVLSELDRAVEGLQMVTTATAIVARIEQTPEERQAGVTRVRWSNAGHPPLVALDATGEPTILGSGDADLLLGIDSRTPRREHEVVLTRGSTVFLYTDGLVERRDQSLDVGIDRLRDALQRFAELPLGVLCDRVLSDLLPSYREDDVALVAVRLQPQDVATRM